MGIGGHCLTDLDWVRSWSSLCLFGRDTIDPALGESWPCTLPQRRKAILRTSSTTVQLWPSSLLWAKHKLHGVEKSCFIFSQHLDKYVSDMLVWTKEPGTTYELAYQSKRLCTDKCDPSIGMKCGSFLSVSFLTLVLVFYYMQAY